MEPAPTPAARPAFREALGFWLKLGFISFGGPTGQIAILHAELVERRRWISEGRFLHALNFCMLLPGPEAQQLATYCGWLLHGLRGGVAAGALFVLPSAVILWALSWLAMAGGDVPWVAAIFRGLQPAVMAIIAAALVRLSGKALHNRVMGAVAGLAFVAIFFLQLPFAAIILAAGVIGFLGARLLPGQFINAGMLPAETDSGSDDAPARPAHVAGIAAICAGLWMAPVLTAGSVFGWNSVFAELGIFFSKAALITFGGAYAVLPYVAQQAVEQHGWLTPDQMMSGLALAETTPGPLIMVLQFVGFAAGWQHPGGFSPLTAGTLAAALTTWVTFVPSFLFIFTLAPFIERLRHNRALHGALSTITAAVVGVILNLAVWFGMHAIVPGPGQIDFPALILAAGLFLGMWRRGWGVIPVILAGAISGLVGMGIFGR